MAYWHMSPVGRVRLGLQTGGLRDYVGPAGLGVLGGRVDVSALCYGPSLETSYFPPSIISSALWKSELHDIRVFLVSQTQHIIIPNRGK